MGLVIDRYLKFSMGSPLNCSRTLTANLTSVESKSKETFVSEDDPRFVDSSDDNMEIIMEAIDTKLLNNEMFKDMSKNGNHDFSFTYLAMFTYCL